MTHEQLQQIRDALEHWHEIETSSGSVIDYTDELDILDAALAAEPQQPFCWYNPHNFIRTCATKNANEYAPLYTAPVAARQSVSMETVYDTIIEWSTAGKGSRRELARRMIALFAAPQREWVGLTAKQVNDVRIRFATNLSVPYFVMIYNAIDAALKVKNHG